MLLVPLLLVGLLLLVPMGTTVSALLLKTIKQETLDCQTVGFQSYWCWWINGQTT